MIRNDRDGSPSAVSLWEQFNLGDRGSTDWMRRGLCGQTDPEVFFPKPGGDNRPAKRVCAACPVLAECHAYALADPSLSGVWGGTSARERASMRRVTVAAGVEAAVDRWVA